MEKSRDKFFKKLAKIPDKNPEVRLYADLYREREEIKALREIVSEIQTPKLFYTAST